MAKNKRQSVKKNVSFLWSPEVHEVRWADSADEVPIWDWTRGPRTNLSKLPRFFNLFWARYNLNDPNDEEEVVSYFRQKLEDDSWTPLPPPKKGYPRLVKASPVLNGHSPVKAETNLINDLSSLVRDRLDTFDMTTESKRLRNEILKLAQTYGSVDNPIEPYYHTAERWLIEGYRVQAHIEAMQALEIDGLEGLGGLLKDRQKQWLSDLGIDETDVLARLYTSPWHQLHTTLIGEWSEIEPKDYDKTAREKVAADLYAKFAHEARHDINLIKGAYYYHVPVCKWANMLLADLWLEGRTIKTCEGCGRMFIAYRTDVLCCHDRCRVRKKSQKLKLANLKG